MKDYLASFISDAKKFQIPTNKELTKLTKPQVKVGSDSSVSFVSDAPKENLEIKPEIESLIIFKSLKDLTDKTDKTCLLDETIPADCPICTAKLKSESTPAVVIWFCPLGCQFVWQRFNDLQAASALLSEMLKTTSEERLTLMSDLLEERAAVFEYSGLTRGDAEWFAQNDLIPRWIVERRQAEILTV